MANRSKGFFFYCTPLVPILVSVTLVLLYLCVINSNFSVKNKLSGLVSEHRQDYNAKEEQIGIRERDTISQNEPKARSNTYILIMAGYRTGSSYTGSMFDVNPHVFYMFEPLALLFTSTYRHKLEKYHELMDKVDISQILWGLFNCQFRKFLSAIRVILTENEQQFSINWLRQMFASIGKRHKISVNESNLEELENLCASYDIVAIKVIRLYDIKSLTMLLKRNVKVIELSRDPRGAALSNNHPRYVQIWCKYINENIEFANTSNSQNVLSQNFRFLRYEDLAIHTKSYGVLMYDFAGLDIPKEVLRHIVFNPVVSLWTGPSKKASTGNSVAKWIGKLKNETVKMLEDSCGAMMDNLGYFKTGGRNVTMDRIFQPVGRVPQATPYVL